MRRPITQQSSLPAARLIITSSDDAITIPEGSSIRAGIAGMRAALTEQGMEIQIGSVLAAEAPANSTGGAARISFIPFAHRSGGRIAWILAITKGNEIGTIYQIGPIPCQGRGTAEGIGIEREEDIIRAIAHGKSAIDIVPRIGAIISKGIPDSAIAPSIRAAYREIGADCPAPAAWIPSKAIWYAATCRKSIR